MVQERSVSLLPRGARRVLARPGRAATPAPSSWGQKGRRCCVSARGRTLDVLQRRGKLPAGSPPRLASGEAAVEREGGRKRPPDPEGHQAALISQASGRRPASQSVRPGAESDATSGGHSLALSGAAAHSLPRPPPTAASVDANAPLPAEQAVRLGRRRLPGARPAPRRSFSPPPHPLASLSRKRQLRWRGWRRLPPPTTSAQATLARRPSPAAAPPR